MDAVDGPTVATEVCPRVALHHVAALQHVLDTVDIPHMLSATRANTLLSNALLYVMGNHDMLPRARTTAVLCALETRRERSESNIRESSKSSASPSTHAKVALTSSTVSPMRPMRSVYKYTVHATHTHNHTHRMYAYHTHTRAHPHTRT